jgi:hypothetical protein
VWGRWVWGVPPTPQTPNPQSPIPYIKLINKNINKEK